ncbi:MAG: hypothetical protein R3C59_13630 [Planctomycetaceae bacterium]
MTRTFLSITVLSLTLSSSASANDIVDFLRAISGPRSVPQHSVRGGRHDHGPVAVHSVSRSRTFGTPVSGIHSVSHRHTSSYRTARPVTLPRSGLSVSLNIGQSGRPVTAVPPVPVYRTTPAQFVGPPQHRIGEFVTCPVPLEPHVTIQDPHRVAPNAVPQVIAVRDPHLGAFGSPGCVERVVYVEILAPPCAPRRVRVSPCGTKIRLDYGRYEVDIVSCDHVIHIDYD